MLGHAGYSPPTRQYELDQTDHTDQESVCPIRSIDNAVGIGDLDHDLSVRGVQRVLNPFGKWRGEKRRIQHASR